MTLTDQSEEHRETVREANQADYAGAQAEIPHRLPFSSPCNLFRPVCRAWIRQGAIEAFRF